VADRSDAHAVVITGAYGTGKTSLVEEIADILEERGDRYGALDLDWLAWFDPGFGDHSAARPVMLKNVDAVSGQLLRHRGATLRACRFDRLDR
jgi:adenylylsulfate kinase-like enzyme